MHHDRQTVSNNKGNRPTSREEKSMNLIPRYTDYKSKAQVLEAWNNNRDFETADIMTGYGLVTNKADLEEQGLAHKIQIRYDRLTKAIYIP